MNIAISSIVATIYLLLSSSIVPATLQHDYSGIAAFNSSKPRISRIAGFDEGSHSSEGNGDPSIDLVQDVCDDSGDQDILEEFHDSILGVDVVNPLSHTAYINKASYIVKNGGEGRRYRSRKLSLIGSSEVEGGNKTTRVFMFFMRASGGEKYFVGSDTPVATALGFQNVRIILRGRDGNGKRFRIRARTALSFANHDRCNS